MHKMFIFTSIFLKNSTLTSPPFQIRPQERVGLQHVHLSQIRPPPGLPPKPQRRPPGGQQRLRLQWRRGPRPAGPRVPGAQRQVHPKQKQPGPPQRQGLGVSSAGGREGTQETQGGASNYIWVVMQKIKTVFFGSCFFAKKNKCF